MESNNLISSREAQDLPGYRIRRLFHALPVALAYGGLIATAEILGVVVNVVLGLVCHAMLVPILLSHYVRLSHIRPYRRSFPVLALLPLLRILSLTTALPQVPAIYWPAPAGIPLLLAMALVVRLINLSPTSLGLAWAAWRPQAMIAGTGVPLSLVGFLVLRPEMGTGSFTWYEVLLCSVLLLVFTGFLEELLFRGLLQSIMTDIVGQYNVLYSATLFAIMYAGWLSVTWVVFVWLVGLFFGWCYQRTGSIIGIACAHGLTSIGMVFVWPSWHAVSPPNSLVQRATSIVELVLWLIVALLLGRVTLLVGRQFLRLIRVSA